MQAGHGLAHFSHRRTEIASFEPCGDINEGRKVFAGKLLLPGHDRNVGDLSHPDDMTIRRSERQVANLGCTRTDIGGASHPNPDQLFPNPDTGGRTAAYQPFDLSCDCGRIEPLLLRNSRPDPHGNGIARDPQAIDHFHNAVDLADCFGNMLRSLFERDRIIAEQLDLDWLGHGGEIANQVFHQLQGFDLDPRNLLFDPAPDVAHYLLNRPP